MFRAASFTLLLLLSACGGDAREPQAGNGTSPEPTETAEAECEPSGTELSISADALAFSTDCLAAPADTAFTIEFDNQDDGVPHNVSIYGVGTEVMGEVINGPDSITYEVEALAAGDYQFKCDVHPQMAGALIVA